MNLSTLPDLRAAQAPDAPAVADDSTDLTNTQFLHAVRRASAVMAAHGVSAGDVVAIMLPNQASYIVALFAAWRCSVSATHRPTAGPFRRARPSAPTLSTIPERLTAALRLDKPSPQRATSHDPDSSGRRLCCAAAPRDLNQPAPAHGTASTQ
jgi:non-ribosomal peptide synthetase component F